MILHRLDQQTKAGKYDAKDVTPTTSKGVFEVNKTNGSKHVVISLLCSIMCQSGVGANFHRITWRVRIYPWILVL